MENNSKFDKFVSKLTCLLNSNEDDSEKADVELFGKYDIAILTFIGILSIALIISIALRFVLHPAYWLLVDIFSLIFLAVLTYYIVIRKLFRKK